MKLKSDIYIYILKLLTELLLPVPVNVLL